MSARSGEFRGLTYRDTNGDRQPQPEERLGQVPIDLYEDDGDGIWNPLQDLRRQRTTSDSQGAYRFAPTPSGLHYFMAVTASADTVVSPLLSSVNPQAVLDDFQRPQQSMRTPMGGFSSTAEVNAQAFPGVTLQRRWDTNLIAGVGRVELVTRGTSTQRSVHYATSAGVVGTAALRWTPEPPSTAGNLSDNSFLPTATWDLTGGGAFSAFYLRAGFDTSAQGNWLTVRLLGPTVQDVSTARVPVPLGSPLQSTQDLVIPWELFQGNVTPQSAHGLEMSWGGEGASVDALLRQVGMMSITPFDISLSPLAVAEPTTNRTELLVGLALCGCLRRRRPEFQLSVE